MLEIVEKWCPHGEVAYVLNCDILVSSNFSHVKVITVEKYSQEWYEPHLYVPSDFTSTSMDLAFNNPDD